MHRTNLTANSIWTALILSLFLTLLLGVGTCQTSPQGPASGFSSLPPNPHRAIFSALVPDSSGWTQNPSTAIPSDFPATKPATLTPTRATYRKQQVGTSSPPKTFTLTNKQTIALAGITISTTGDFAVSATTCGTTLAPKANCAIDVTFTPFDNGIKLGQLIVNDSASNSPLISYLKGKGAGGPTLVSIAINPTNATVAVGSTLQFQAFGSYSDGSRKNITNEALWSSSDVAIATITPGGLATGVAPGAVTIIAAYEGIDGAATLTVTSSEAMPTK